MGMRTRTASWLLGISLGIVVCGGLARAEITAAASAKTTARSCPGADRCRQAAGGCAKDVLGLYSRVLQKGTGTVHPKAGDTVEVNYAGWMTDGKLFDTSQRKSTAKFPLDLLIKGWQRASRLMVVGEAAHVDSRQPAYGENAAPSGRPARACWSSMWSW